MDHEGLCLIVVAAPEVGRLDEGRERAVQPRHEDVNDVVEAGLRWLRAARSAGEVGGYGTTGDVNVAGRGMDREGLCRIEAAAPEVGRLGEGRESAVQPRDEGVTPAVVRRLRSSSGAGKVGGTRSTRDVDVAGRGMDRKGGCHSAFAAPEV